MSPFVEATVVYYADGDPRDAAAHRSQKRLVNLANVWLITPTADGSGRSIFHMSSSSTPYFAVLEPYEYWSAILTAEQPRRV